VKLSGSDYMTPDEFRQLLREKTVAEIVEKHVVTDDPGPFISNDAIDFFKEKIRAVFQLQQNSLLDVIVVGSAKLGFSFLEKPARNGAPYKPAYRAYQSGVSDVDVAIASPDLYEKIWRDLCRYGAAQSKFPWRTDVGSYMFHGWIRPDKFPLERPQRCLDWNRVVNEVSRSRHFRYKQLRCAIYHSKWFLETYQQRGIGMAQQAEQKL